jgi:2-(1,2-epoxy-1,2-dihydrophenyl)acetyl-CoA isomerase
MEAAEWLRTEDRGPIRWLTMERPDRRNAIPPQGWSDLVDAFQDFERAPARILVIAGAGGAFCSGADLDPALLVGRSVTSQHQWMKTVGAAAAALHRCPKPTIAAVDGIAAGAGLNLALACDVVIASTRARFSEIFVRRGLTVDFGGTWILPRIVGLQRAKEMALSGRILDATEARDFGLVLDVVDEGRFEERVNEVADSFLAGAPIAQMFAKQGLNRAFEVSLAEALAFEGQAQSICGSTEDVVEGVSAFLEKRPPHFKGR